MPQAKKPIPEFIVNEGKALQFRQTRYELEDPKLKLHIQKKHYTLENWSRSGIGFITPKAMDFKNHSLHEIQIHYDDILIHEGVIKITSIRETSEPNETFIGASFVESFFKIEGVESATTITEVSSKALSFVDSIEEMKGEFCKAVVALQIILIMIKTACEKEELRLQTISLDLRSEAEQIFLPNMAEKVRSILFVLNQKVAKAIDVQVLELDSVFHQVFEQLIFPFFKDADLIRRAHDKPRGYAGDYEMMNQVYRDGFEGKSLFGRVLHHYATIENSGSSVKFRRPYLVNTFETFRRRQKPTSVLSIGSGPAVEYQDILKTWEQADLTRFRFVFCDLDREALEHAQKRIWEISAEEEKQPNVYFMNASVKAFLTSHNFVIGKFDLIYSAGMFDYLEIRTCQALIKAFHRLLNPGGRIVLGNFKKNNENMAFLDLLCQWHLIYKTEAEMLSLTEGLENVEVRIENDPKDIFAFLVIESYEPC